MNLFEKIFNHQILSRLEDSGTYMVTSHERAWLKTMLEHPAAGEAFTGDTLGKLRSLLASDEAMDVSNHLIEKACSMEKQIYHPLLRPCVGSLWTRAASGSPTRLKAAGSTQTTPVFRTSSNTPWSSGNGTYSGTTSVIAPS